MELLVRSSLGESPFSRCAVGAGSSELVSLLKPAGVEVIGPSRYLGKPFYG